ncbi:jupiter microtubule associated homolog 1-like [Chrysoperla carnea]|uniref:jupiter microtubule associated homolog 1-like n=1 Tax=Chrysoperla carnea TaxID=189513 RepID=UPI001D060918|nr:jupiter microtubule associated homolog 1-like [Chrysoperla carnea]
MTSTSINIGIASESRNSSRVLKPPGGGYSNIFGDPTPQEVPQRPKNNQQNSAGMSAVMGTTDANEVAAKTNELIAAASSTDTSVEKDSNKSNSTTGSPKNDNQASRKRVPPGGFSSGLW